MNRKPISLNNSFGDLQNMIIEGYNSNFGPGDLPTKARGKIKAVIAPNYDYCKASAAYAWAFKEIAESENALYIIIGRCLEGFNTYLFGDWETPLGIVKVDVNFGKELIRRFPKLRNDSNQFLDDEIIEKQLACLQYAKKDELDKIRVLPILVGDVEYENLVEFAKVLSSIGNKAVFIFCGNFTCYGEEFGYVPFLHGIKENLHILDEKLIELIINMDSIEFYKQSKRIKDRNIFVLGIEVVRGLGGRMGSLLNYYTSGEIDNDYRKSVGVGAIVFR